MTIYTKYSNERRREFCIRTEIREENGERTVRKSASFPEAEAHIRSMEEKYQALSRSFAGTRLTVNACTLKTQPGGVTAVFPYRTGRTLEERLDGLLQQKKTEELLEEIRRYFALLADGAEPFVRTEAFDEVFGDTPLESVQQSRTVSDIDMIFSNAIETGQGYELIDYEWTFAFPVPVKFLQYRCLYYYALGNAKRARLANEALYAQFGITKEECRVFAQMERSFQSYILGTYTPIWKQYEDISEGVLPLAKLLQNAAEERAMRTAEAFFDDGRGFGIWSQKRYQTEPGSRIFLRIELPKGTKALRIDPCSARSVVRIERISQEGTALSFMANGEQAPNGDYLFDTEDPQLVISELPHGDAPVEAVFFAERMSGLARETLLNQNGRLRWMEQTKVWKLYRKLKGGDGR